MKTKAQISIFIMFGIVIVIATSFIFYIKSPNQDFEEIIEETPLEMLPIRTFVEGCIKEVAYPGIYTIALQGGYYELPEKTLLAEKASTPYYYYEDEELTPTKEELEAQISIMLKNTLPFCIKNFTAFKEEDIETENIKAEAVIKNNEIVILLDFPITLKKQDSKYNINKFLTRINVSFGKAFGISKNIIQKTIQNQEEIDIIWLTNQSLGITIIPVDEERLIYSIIDNSTRFDNEPFIFMFSEKVIINNIPKLDFIPDFYVKLAKTISYDVNASDNEGHRLRYYAANNIVDINETSGIFEFISHVTGNYTEKICVEDIKNAKSCQEVLFIVEE